jgi:hypothetical protein
MALENQKLEIPKLNGSLWTSGSMTFVKYATVPDHQTSGKILGNKAFESSTLEYLSK